MKQVSSTGVSGTRVSGIGGRWTSWGLIKTLWTKFWRDAHQVPSLAWRRWAETLLIGLGLGATLVAGITRYAQTAETAWLKAWDERWLPIAAESAPLSFAKSITWESPGNLLIALPLVLVFIGIMVWRSKPLIAATTAAAYVLQFALVWVGWGLWHRQRPQLIADGIAASSLHSFPSGHTVIVVAVYGFMAYLWLRAASNWLERATVLGVYGVFAFRIITARLVLGAHWPSDVVAGLILGLFWLVVVITAFNRAEGMTRRART
ncbi:MAG TPA: phosphatase PAP2 family protein [Trichocoleus sp.]